jgi:hypothetical protein
MGEDSPILIPPHTTGYMPIRRESPPRAGEGEVKFFLRVRRRAHVHGRVRRCMQD